MNMDIGPYFSALDPIIQNAIGGALGTLVCAALSVAIRKCLLERVKIKRVTRADDSCLEEALELYSELFPPDGTNYTADEVLTSFKDQEGRVRSYHVPEENFFLIAKHRGDVIGFIWCCYYPDRQHGIIPYYGIKSRLKEARLGAATMLAKRLASLLLRQNSPCRRLVFETLKPIATLPPRKLAERTARIRRFKTLGNQLKSRVVEPDFAYRRPRLSLEDDAHSSEEDLVLMYVNLGEKKGSLVPGKIKKETLMEILEFIHLDCYGDFYEPLDPKHLAFQAYLKNRLVEFRESLPELIDTKPSSS